MYKINENIQFSIKRDDANFDRAADSAYIRACRMFEVDEAGYCHNVDDWNTLTDMIIIEFKSYSSILSLTGQSHVYVFVTRIERNDE